MPCVVPLTAASPPPFGGCLIATVPSIRSRSYSWTCVLCSCGLLVGPRCKNCSRYCSGSLSLFDSLSLISRVYSTLASFSLCAETPRPLLSPFNKVLCAVCHPFSAHLFERLDVADGLTMTIEFCDNLYSTCSAELGLPDDYCNVHTGGEETDQYWSYPLVIDCESRVGPFAYRVALYTFSS